MIKEYLNNIVAGDCLELIKNIPDNSVDLTFADPPFNLKKNYTKYEDSKELDDYLNWCEKWIKEMVRVTKPSGSICVHNIPMWLTYYASFLNKHAYFRHWISWDALSKPRGNSLQPAHYGILFYAKDRKKQKVFEIRSPHKRDRRTGFLQKDYGGKKNNLHPYGPILTDVWTDIHRIKHNGLREEHPCQLPIQLLERIILLTTNKGNVVLDLFAGTGVTAVAAKKLGRKFIAFEIDENYIKISQERLLKTNLETKLASSYVSVYRNSITTIRDNDWEKIKKYFIIPKPIKLIDKHKLELKDKNIFKTLQKVNGIKQVKKNKPIKLKVITLNSSLESVRVV
jgi:site-specific DNA-methyltransferase (adenine-specific)